MTISEKITSRPDVLKKASVRAGSALGITRAQFARIVGIDEASLDGPIDPTGDAGLRARQLVQIYLSRYALTGNDRIAMTHWMKTNSRQLGSSPIERMQTADGLHQTLCYLESLRP
jgi:hypothetical protein